MVLEPIHCPDYDGIDVIGHGQQPQVGSAIAAKTQSAFGVVSFESTATEVTYPIKQQITDMAINGSDSRYRSCAGY